MQKKSTMRVHAKNIDVLNTGLLLLSFAASLFLPFQLFLFSYAVLGPLHYLTEILWLKDRSFFTKRKNDWVIFTLGTVFVLLVSAYTSALALFSLFFLALVMTLTERLDVRVGAMILLPILFGFFAADPVITLFSVFVPTLIHVFLFTALFMLFGALKSKSPIGKVNVGLLLLLAVVIFVMPSLPTIEISESVRASYELSFILLHEALYTFFGIEGYSVVNVFSSELGISVMQFIAFSYTYHYINWFSKTGVIGWGKSVEPYLKWVIGIWVFSVALYLVSYQLGILALLFLSLLHVVLEFPLNHQSIIGIGKHVWYKVNA